MLSSKDYVLLKLLNYVQESQNLRLARFNHEGHLLGTEAMMQDSWLAEVRVPLDRLYHFNTSRDLSPSSWRDDTALALVVDENEVRNNSAATTSKCAEHPQATLTRFQSMVHDLPPELFRLVKDMMFEEAFGPKRVFPYEDPTIMNIFLALNKQLYQKYSNIYWCQNTWVVGQGPADRTMRFMIQKPYDARIKEFSLQIPNRLALEITSVHMLLSRRDVPRCTEWIEDPETRGDKQLGLKDRLVIQQFQNEREYFKSTAFRTWQDKFDRLAVLNLRHLTLDLTDAFAPDGEYVGVNAVERFIPFVHGLPPDLRILAPTKALMQEIRNVFDAMNTR